MSQSCKHRKRVGNQRLYKALSRARREIRMAVKIAEWFYSGDLSDGPETLARIDTAISALTRARGVLLRDMGQPEDGTQGALFETPVQWIRPCGECGHGTMDHREGLRCIICGCRTYRAGVEPQVSEGYGIRTPDVPAGHRRGIDSIPPDVPAGHRGVTESVTPSELGVTCYVQHEGPCPEGGEADGAHPEGSQGRRVHRADLVPRPTPAAWRSPWGPWRPCPSSAAWTRRAPTPPTSC